MFRWHVAVLGLAFGMLMGCSQEVEVFELHAQVQSTESIKLPEKPDFSKALAKLEPQKVSGNNNTPVYSPDSLIFHQKLLINRDELVRVRGIVSEISEDCPELTHPRTKKSPYSREDILAARKERRCRTLNFKMLSSDEGAREVTVTDYHPLYHSHIQKGMEIELSGKYVQFGNGLVSWKNGIILVSEFHNIGVDKSGHFTTKRAEIMEMIAKCELAGMEKDTK